MRSYIDAQLVVEDGEVVAVQISRRCEAEPAPLAARVLHRVEGILDRLRRAIRLERSVTGVPRA